MSEKQINLLPKAKLRQLRLRTWYLGLLRVYSVTACSFAVVLLLQGGVWWYLHMQGKNYEAETVTLQEFAAQKENADIRKEVKQVNNRVTDYNTLGKNAQKWSKLLVAFAGVVPPGVQIQSFNVDGVKKQVTISGYAPTRELVIELHDNIAANKEAFTKLDYPLENVSKPTNINFHFTFTVQDAVLK